MELLINLFWALLYIALEMFVAVTSFFIIFVVLWLPYKYIFLRIKFFRPEKEDKEDATPFFYFSFLIIGYYAISNNYFANFVEEIKNIFA